jgi:hypothetical protein
MKKTNCCEQSHSSCIQNTSFSSRLTNGPNKVECLSFLSFYGVLQRNTLAYVTERTKRCEQSHSSCIQNTSFSSRLTNGPNKVECLSFLSFYGVLQRNTLAYVTERTKRCEQSHSSCIQNTSFSSRLTNGPNKLECLSLLSFSSVLA